MKQYKVHTSVKKEEGMKTPVIVGVVAMFLAGGMAVAQESLVDTVAKGCEQELKTYCKEVTPGEGRVLACLYSYWDKLSGQCDYALYDAAAQLDRAVAALSYVANECRDDLTKFCSNIKPGEGRLLQCIDWNDAKVSKRCKQALKETGLKK
jgi:hypothetical protein